MCTLVPFIFVERTTNFFFFGITCSTPPVGFAEDGSRSRRGSVYSAFLCVLNGLIAGVSHVPLSSSCLRFSECLRSSHARVQVCIFWSSRLSLSFPRRMPLVSSRACGGRVLTNQAQRLTDSLPQAGVRNMTRSQLLSVPQFVRVDLLVFIPPHPLPLLPHRRLKSALEPVAGTAGAH